jgi:hypothetical protein
VPALGIADWAAWSQSSDIDLGSGYSAAESIEGISREHRVPLFATLDHFGIRKERALRFSSWSTLHMPEA